MSYLIDTNVVSELIRKQPSKNVQQWFESVPNEAVYISVLTLGEIRKGIEGLPNNKRKEKLRLWLEIELPSWFDKRILIIDQAVADRWGRLCNEMGRPIPAIDSLIAATALQNNFYLVTRNKKDFPYPSLQLINPWD